MGRVRRKHPGNGPKATLPATPGLAAVPKCRGDSPSESGSLLHLQHLCLLWVLLHTKVGGTCAVLRPGLGSLGLPEALVKAYSWFSA
jgi:hypothetical protein